MRVVRRRAGGRARGEGRETERRADIHARVHIIERQRGMELERWQGIRGSRGEGRAKRKTRRKEQRERNEGAGQRESAEREGREGGGGWRPVVVAGGWVAAREGARGGSTVNSPIQCSYHLPLSLTTHRRRPRPPSCAHPLAPHQPSAAPYLPACLLACLPWLRLADVPCLTGKLNRYFTVSYPPPRLRRPPPSSFLPFQPLSRPPARAPAARSSCPAAEGKTRRARVERREASSFPPIALPRERHGAAARRTKPRRAGWAALFSLTLDARVANIYLHIVLHVMIM